ncbi:MAG: hypothetical protein DWQ36_08395 [Acidobacteria bacterium]|nr:MAG: hypothetical protein DWQ30_23010 [Acidobacteriota bacterium]REK08666.1 MAG: hypothetical protein DWQ36_08395 [Acidobacteriota bacterium]
MVVRRLLPLCLLAGVAAFALLQHQPAAHAAPGSDGVSAASYEALATRLGAVEGSMSRYLKGLSAQERSELKAQLGALSADQRTALRQQVRSSRRPEGASRRVAAPESATAAQRGSNPTLQYDTGVPHDFRVPTVNVPAPRGGRLGDLVGNYFDTGFGDPHTISQVQFQMNGVFTFGQPQRGGSLTLIVAGPPSAGGQAPIQFSVFSTASVGLNTWTLSDSNLQGMSGPFVVVVSQSPNQTGSGYTPYSPSTTRNNIAVDVNSQGGGRGNAFHGITFTGGGGKRGPTNFVYGANPSPTVPDVTPMGGPDTGAPLPFNAILRVIGPSLPVELMSFGVDE